MVRRSKEPLTAATTNYIFPYLKNEGFIKASPRFFVREKNNFFQQIRIDANGFSGKKSTVIVCCVNPTMDESLVGYTIGYRLDDSERWDMSSHEIADSNAQDIIKKLVQFGIPDLNKWSCFENYIALYEKYALYDDQELLQGSLKKIRRWSLGELTESEKQQIKINRNSLKLITP